MVIVLTDHRTGNKFTVQAQTILFSQIVPVEVDRRDKSIIAAHAGVIESTLVVTGITGPGGKLQSFHCKETPIEIGRMQNAVAKCHIKPEKLGFPVEPVPAEPTPGAPSPIVT